MSIIEAWSITGNDDDDDAGIKWIFNELNDEYGRGWVVGIIENETVLWCWGVNKNDEIITFDEKLHFLCYSIHSWDYLFKLFWKHSLNSNFRFHKKN